MTAVLLGEQIAALGRAIRDAEMAAQSRVADNAEFWITQAAALRAALARLEAAEWRLIDADEPYAATPVLVATDEGAVGEARYHEDYNGWWWAGSDPTDAHDGQVRYPRYYRPLPLPPPPEGG